MTTLSQQTDHLRVSGGTHPVVLLHGIGAGAEMFAPQIADLGRDFDAIGWNMPGYGGTELGSEMTFDGLVDALARFLDREGLEAVDLLGHSIGGMLAQAFIARHPERVRRLVLSATTAAFGSRDGTFQKRFVADRLAPLDAGRTMPELARDFVPDLVGSGAAPEAVPAAIAAMSQVPHPTFRAAIRCLATFDAREALPRISVPVLLVAGEEDRNAPAPTMRKMADRISGARFVTLPGIGHLAPLEAPRAFTDHVRRFLKDQ
ncbi:alpha/beta hydrolase [Stappia sp.]|uniref:alpha/beta fold hydrolase n=1 Tax=Stappia sp. TaxID=1870903 RepID=UPI0032D93233